ncbi:Clavaminate synthase-like protein [Setomelanomma holmii]|uniref:Clavaminate synthase-like protein n=1 Tax=Setomelanomma holmii TaxID=210430 RepID=A0A9P4LSK4_9PLEO|nr:Clavaminate synthase-like protein [Setomelanomma holmii]
MDVMQSRNFDCAVRRDWKDVERWVFILNRPAKFPNYFADIPAIEKWFKRHETDKGSRILNTAYLDQFGDSIVPLELTQTSDNGTTTFERFEAPLSLLLAHMTGAHTSNTRLYLAQHSLADLPSVLQADMLTPTTSLKQLGRGDIYASSLWMGRPPTRTPLHRDPNPNLFVQLAGQKVVRLMQPDAGRALYEKVRAQLGEAGGRANMRGEKMMQGAELEAMESAVWDDDEGGGKGVEAVLDVGDGLYIPLGWWHAVRGVGPSTSANASVNWWFR